MDILSIYDKRFKKYGKVLTGYDFSELLEVMKDAPCPEDVIYEPSIAALENLDIAKEFSIRAYGELPVQLGYCNGNNNKLNAVEYHRNSELNIAATDAVLILGLQQDIEDDYTYDTSKMEAFLVPKGAGVELYATTLHYAPCNAAEGGFKVVVVLPKGTNYPLTSSHGASEDKEDLLITAVNKWLIGHSEGGLPEGSFIGLKGENLQI